MTEQDERTIYEWATPALKGKQWKISNDRYWIICHDDHALDTERPPLDMNFAFDVCIPKLNAASVSVTFTNFDDAGRWHLIDVVCDVECRNTTASVDHEATDFYDALLAYIKGVK